MHVIRPRMPFTGPPCSHPSMLAVALAGVLSLGAPASPEAATAPPSRVDAAPTLTRVVDPANPVTTEAYESGGAGWIDLNGDGFLDLFVPNGNLVSQDNSLFVHTSGLSFQRVATGPVVHDGGSSIGGVWGDWNRDGHPDLFVTNRASFGNFLYQGVGDTAFVNVTGVAAVDDRANSNSASWVDVDNDGDLDLYVVNFAGADFLYLNSGPPSFALVSTPVPSLTPGAEFSIHGTWADFDDDGDEDFFVGNAGTQNDYLYVNGGGLAFVKRTIPDGRASLSASWGDFDQDGLLDLFVANRGNPSILYRNGGPPGFALTAVPPSIYTPDLANSVGSAWGDADNDGDLDLFVSNDGAPSFFYLNAGPPTYALTRTDPGSPLTQVVPSFGCSWADVDRDGDLDLFVANQVNVPNDLYRNDGPAGNWLAVQCVGTQSNPSGVGARVRVLSTIDGTPRWQTQQVMPLTGYNSQNLELHFGLGDATGVDSLVIRWPSGHIDAFGMIGGDRVVTVTEGLGATDAPAAASARDLSLALRSPNPASNTVDFEYALASAAHVRLELVDVTGRSVAVLESRRMEAGTHRVRYDRLGGLPSGRYWGRLRAGDATVRVPIAIVH